MTDDERDQFRELIVDFLQAYKSSEHEELFGGIAALEKCITWPPAYIEFSSTERKNEAGTSSPREMLSHGATEVLIELQALKQKAHPDDFITSAWAVDRALRLGFIMAYELAYGALDAGKAIALKEAASKAAKARHKGQKQKVIARYHELLKYEHFKNGSRASIARKIASEPGITVTEITVGRWIKAEVE